MIEARAIDSESYHQHHPAAIKNTGSKKKKLQQRTSCKKNLLQQRTA
jgi:hypothetical protein